MNVGVDREGWNTERLGHDDLRRFVTDAGQLFKFFQRLGDLAAVLRHQNPGESVNGFGFLRSQTAGTDNGLDLFDGNLAQGCRGPAQGEESWCDLVDPGIGALSRKQHRNEQSERIAVIERDGRIRIEFRKPLLDESCPLRLGHGGSLAALDALNHFPHVLIVGTRFHDGQALGKGSPFEDADVHVANTPGVHGRTIGFVEIDRVGPDQR